MAASMIWDRAQNIYNPDDLVADWTDQEVSTGESGPGALHGRTQEQSLRFTGEALSLAMERDGSSGGVARLAAISEEGVERHVILGNQLPTFYRA